MHLLRLAVCFIFILVAPSLANAKCVSEQQKRIDALSRAVPSTVEGKATGTVLVAKKGKVLFARSFTDPKQVGFHPSITTSYDLASIGKAFTAVLALKLADQRRFDLDAPLRRYLPELPAAMDDITARKALSHTAGLPRYLEGDDLVRRTSAQAIAEIAAMKRERKTGEYYYSNVGPTLVALAIERAAGDTYPNLVRKLIFKPIGMRNSYFHGDPKLMKVSVAPAYAGGQKKGSPAEWPETWTMLGSAGISASVKDLLRFSQSVFAGNYLSKNARSQLLGNGASTGGRASFKTADTLDIHYGSGLYHWRDRKGRRVHFHGGGSDFGSNTGMLWREDDDVFIAVLLNSSTDAFTREAFYSAVLEALE